MKHIVITAVSGILLASGLILVSIPSGWDVVPVINNYFSLQTGLWQNAHLADDLEQYEFHNEALEAEVHIERTDRGAPVIHAESYKDAMAALGYVTARDRYFQMKLQARMAEGTISQWFGPGFAEFDRAFLNLGLEETAWDHLTNLSEDNYELIAAYSSGVNAYINEHFHSAAPVEFKLENLPNRYWRPVDSMRNLLMLAYRSAFNTDDIQYQRVINHIGPDAFREFYPVAGAAPDQLNQHSGIDLTEISRVLRFAGDLRQRLTLGINSPLHSNALMATGEITNNGKTLWTVDLHSLASLPSHWYEARIVLPERELHGVTLPGYPGFWTMTSDYIAYSLTDAGIDETDWYLIELNEDSTQYRLDGDWHRLQTKDYEIGSNGEYGEATVRFTRYGPVIPDTRPAISFSSVFQEAVVEPMQLKKLALANSAEELDQHRKSGRHRPLKMMAGDRRGNGFVGISGLVPLRSSPVGLSDGAEPESRWDGFVPSDELPVRYLEEQKLITADEVFPEYNRHYLGINPPPAWRQQRLTKLVSNHLPIAPDDLTAFFTDAKIPMEPLQPLIEEANSRRYDTTLRELTEMLRDWDYQASRESNLPLLMDYFIRVLRREVWRELVEYIPPSDKAFWDELIAGVAITATHNPEAPLDPVELLGRTIPEAYDAALIEYGRVTNWSWDGLNQLRLEHPAGLGRYSVLDYGTIPRAGFPGTLTPAPSRNSRFASTYRLAVWWNAEDGTEVQSFKLGGSSGDPMSRFYRPMISEWERGQLFPVKPFESNSESFGDAAE